MTRDLMFSIGGRNLLLFPLGKLQMRDPERRQAHSAFRYLAGDILYRVGGTRILSILSTSMDVIGRGGNSLLELEAFNELTET